MVEVTEANRRQAVLLFKEVSDIAATRLMPLHTGKGRTINVISLVIRFLWLLLIAGIIAIATVINFAQ